MKLKKSSLKWALAHVERFGDTDIFPVPFEYQAIRQQWSEILPQLEDLDVTRYQVRELRQTLTPKSRYGFRLATQLHPIDALIFAALVYEIAHDLETHRLPKAADRVVSHRVSRGDDGQLYDPEWNYERFKAILRARCAEPSVHWVVMTDIADFYTRIYHHPLENALRRSADSSHVDAVMALLGQWTFRESYGVPVGPAATRVLAEVAIADVDRALLAEGVDFCRFSDDFRLFATTEREAFRSLSVLASYLQDLGLTLSERKTDILTATRFADRHLDGGRPGDAAQLSDRVGQILERHGRQEDKYALLEVDQLPEELIRELDALDLNSVLTSQIEGGQRMFDAFAVSIALRRLAQLEDPTVLDLVLDNLDHLVPVLPQVVNFLRRVTPARRKPEIGERLINTIASGLSSHREYQRIWLLSLFAEDGEWDNAGRLMSLLGEVTDEVSRPMLLRALGVADQRQWFRRERRQIQSMSGWQRRAFMRGATCMPRDEYVHWMQSTLPRLDLLDQSVGRFCVDLSKAAEV